VVVKECGVLLVSARDFPFDVGFEVACFLALAPRSGSSPCKEGKGKENCFGTLHHAINVA
jgi:hypothetical protein